MSTVHSGNSRVRAYPYLGPKFVRLTRPAPLAPKSAKMIPGNILRLQSVTNYSPSYHPCSAPLAFRALPEGD